LLENPLRGLDSRHAGWWVEFVTALWRGHPLMGGRRVTVVASTDEFRPWLNTGARFAELRKKSLRVLEDKPADETYFDEAAVGEET